MYIADTLSRAYQSRKYKKKEFEEDSLRIHCTSITMPATNAKLLQIKEETRKDSALSKVLEFISNDEWSQAHCYEEPELKYYRTIAQEHILRMVSSSTERG